MAAAAHIAVLVTLLAAAAACAGDAGNSDTPCPARRLPPPVDEQPLLPLGLPHGLKHRAWGRKLHSSQQLQQAPPSCTPGYLLLHYVGRSPSNDLLATCLGSAFRIDLSAACQVQLTSLQPTRPLVPAMWAAAPGVVSTASWAECPSQGPPTPIPATPATSRDQSRQQAVRSALSRALASFVFGRDEAGVAIHPTPVARLALLPGKLLIRRLNGPTLVYAVSEAVGASNADLSLDGSLGPISRVSGCAALSGRAATYLGRPLCVESAGAGDALAPCPGGSHAVLSVAGNGSRPAFKVCGWCPAGMASFDALSCTACPAGTHSKLGGSCQDCPAGTYSNAGSSVCFPCPSGTYASAARSVACTDCPLSTYAHIPGSTVCLRCPNGLPERCPYGACPSGRPAPDALQPPPTTHIAYVGPMLSNSGACALNSSRPNYEVKAFTKCTAWGTTGLRLAFTVWPDCSIQIAPISDPSCADPASTTGHPYGELLQRAYYAPNAATGGFNIRSLLGSGPDPAKSVVLAIDADMSARWFGVTTNASEAWRNTLIRGMPGLTLPQVCRAALTVAGGRILGSGNLGPGMLGSGNLGTGDLEPGALAPRLNSASWSCPAGSFHDQTQICPACPVGMWCPGGPSVAAALLACPPHSYNSIIGLGGACTACPAGAAPAPYSSEVAAQKCEADKICGADPAQSLTYDPASGKCKPCPAGTFRQYGLSPNCTACPPGTFSAAGDATCTPCPPGQYNAQEGLADRYASAGLHCYTCPEGSMALASGNASANTPPTTGSTYCDACLAGTFLPSPELPCQLCPLGSYRPQAPAPGNNTCLPVPAGFYVLPEDASLSVPPRTRLELCPPGTVSFYYQDTQGGVTRVPAGTDTSCIPCAALDGVLGVLRWAHTFAPHVGMSACLPCPGGTVPQGNSSTGGTDACALCPHGQWRAGGSVSATCAPCPAGFEVGPFNKTACRPCHPGTFMTLDRAASGTPESNLCERCPLHFFRPDWGEAACLPCPRGTEALKVGSSECTACRVGHHNDYTGIPCQPAPPGFYVNVTGAFLPTPCPPGTYAPTTRSSACEPCPRGFQCPSSAMGTEGACPPGTLSSTTGNQACSSCPVNTFSLGGANAAAPIAVHSCIACALGTDTRTLTGQSRCQVKQIAVARSLRRRSPPRLPSL